MLRVLILGGTTEASELARMLVGDRRFEPTLSLAGRTKAPVLPPIAWRIGGFGGVAGLAEYLRADNIHALVDATHPFAAQMTRHACEAAALAGVGLLRVDRPEWRPAAGDRWLQVPDMPAAAHALGTAPRRVLLTIGQQDLAPFAAAPWHDYVIRSVDAPAAESLPAGAKVITARGPFAEPEERALLVAQKIAVLVSKNSGGSATAAKLAAARELGLRVVIVKRPPVPAVETVTDAAGALAWLVHQAASTRRGV
jgi:precorrin-6A/cobalt-precorrin-6A reductase